MFVLSLSYFTWLHEIVQLPFSSFIHPFLNSVMVLLHTGLLHMHSPVSELQLPLPPHALTHSLVGSDGSHGFPSLSITPGHTLSHCLP